MKKEQKIAGDGILTLDSGWSFSGDVVANFDKHINKSVPLYEMGHDLVCDLSNFFVKENSIIYEIGCSTGSLTKKICLSNPNKKNARYIGFDIESDMIIHANKFLDKSLSKKVSFVNKDIVNAELEKSDLIVCYYTLQFIPPAVRQIVMDKIYKSLNWGGALIMFEKVRFPDARFQDIISTTYMDYKLKQGYSESDIVNKTMSLKGILEPFSTLGNIDLMKRSGFADIASVQKFLCFEGFLAIK